MKKSIKEFKEFISRGNVLDMAIGVIIGGAFSKIISSLVNDIFMPLLGILLGGIDYSDLYIKVGKAKILYGSFIQNIVDFTIIAFCIFMFMKIINKITKKVKKPEPKEEIKEREEITLLKEIRDSLKKKK